MLRPALALALLSAFSLAHAAPDLSTVAERSGFIRTGRMEEVAKLCTAFEQTYPKQAKCVEFGRSPEGRPMQALIVSRAGALTPAAAHARALPVIFVQGGIHAGEIDGKDAGFLALREALDGKAAKGALDKEVVVFIPVFNVDGHEIFGKWNRPNQRGPEEMGWRTTGQNYNLNRDYMKADTPEMANMLALVNAWDPLVYMDLHVTDGAKFQHDVSIQVEPVNAGDAQMRAVGRALRDGVIADIAKQGSMPQSFYMSFAQDDDPSSGFIDSVAEPRFSTSYFQLRNRIAMLVETHSWKDYATRVRVTHNTIVSMMERVAADGANWLKTAHAADARALTGDMPLTFKTLDKAEIIDFKGYAYTRTPSDVSGALMTHYDESTPQIWHVPLRQTIVPDLQAAVPGAGYIVPAAHADWMGRKLALHGISFRKLDRDVAHADVDSFRATTAKFAASSFENHQRVSLQGAWQKELQTIAKGALFVPIRQPKARLVMALLEPLAPDSFAAWGFFNNAFEHKEYMEDYVAEDVAREQLKDPAVAAAFRNKLESDPAFAKDPRARLEFFARRHTSWDTRFNLYPILRANTAP